MKILFNIGNNNGDNTTKAMRPMVYNLRSIIITFVLNNDIIVYSFLKEALSASLFISL